MAGRWQAPILDRAYSHDDCECPVEEWIYRGISLWLHFEPDGSLDLFADTGDWEAEVTLKAENMAEARKEAFAWVDALPFENR